MGFSYNSYKQIKAHNFFYSVSKSYSRAMYTIFYNTDCQLEVLKDIIQADYEYDDNAVHEIKSDQGMRLVGASRAQTSNYPFLVGYSTLPKNKKDFTSCTGESMIIK